MSNVRAKGIVSPWATVAPQAPSVLPPVQAKTDRDDELPDTASVRFKGQRRAIYTQPLHGKGDDARAGLIALGRGLLAVLAEVPASKECFDKQSIGFSKPTQVHITLDLAGVPFYAVTTTADPELARRMAIDRIAFALTEASVRFPRAREILEKHKIEVTNV